MYTEQYETRAEGERFFRLTIAGVMARVTR